MFPDEFEHVVRARQRERRERAAAARARRRRVVTPTDSGRARRMRETVGFRLVEVGLRVAVVRSARLPGRVR